MALDNYFADELDYLRRIGRELSQERPHLAAFLAEKGSDPDVERLLEGFALLVGNLRAKIDDQFPELTHSLLAMLWPNYLRPIPAMTVIEYLPIKNIITSATQVKRGAQLLSRPLDIAAEEPQPQSGYSQGEEKVQCTFTQSRDLWLLPVELEDIRVTNSNEMAVLSLTFSTNEENSLNDLSLNKLRLWLGESGYTSYQLYFWFSYYFSQAELHIGDRVLPLPDLMLSPSGFNNEDALLPAPRNATPGYRILQDYFCFPESFLFYDITGFPDFDPDLRAASFTLKLCFSRPLPPEVKIRRDSLRLHCVPAVNLFDCYSESILLDGTQAEYPLRVSHRHPDYYDIFSVNRVESWLTGEERKHGALRRYSPFESFQHQIEYSRNREKLYYRIRVRQSPFRPGMEHTIAFVRGDEATCMLRDETVSVSLTCTNRDLPALLQPGDISIATRDNPSFASFRNVTRPTRPLYPVMDGSLHWSLLSNMSLNYLSLLNKDALIQILQPYDFPGLHDRQAARASQKRLEGIKRIETRPVDRLFRGTPVRGLETTLWLDQEAFSCEGELYLFGSVLARFFSLYASVNAFHLLKVINTSNKESYEWPVQTGQRALI